MNADCARWAGRISAAWRLMPPRCAPRHLGRFCFLCVFLLFITAGAAEGSATNDVVRPVRIKVSGFGVLANASVRSSLLQLLPDTTLSVADVNFVEDAFMVLYNRLVDDGYREPMVVAEVTLTNGYALALWWDGEGEIEVPRDLQATELHFKVLPGVLHFYHELEVRGIKAISQEQAEGFFLSREALLNPKTARRYSTDRLRSSSRDLRRELANRGYREAVVRTGDLRIDNETGRVKVIIHVDEGPRYVVREFQLKLLPTAGTPDVEPPRVGENQPFTIGWEQDVAQAINVQLYGQGYPDAQTRVTEVGRNTRGPIVELTLVAEVDPGEQVALGEVRFRGAVHVRESFLERRARLDGPLLDRVEADRVRERLARLGHFRFVALTIEPEDGSPRDVVYELTEGKRYELSLLGGYGSYDQLFGGAEFEHFNLWGLGHNSRLKLIQSFKSTVGAYTYTVPEFLAPHLNAFGAFDGFQREELTFDRQEIKLSLGLRRQFVRSDQQMGLRYSYQFLDAETAAAIEERIRAAAIIADWQQDRRDNPLLPRTGHRLFANLEYATPALGGQAEYARLELGGSYHHSFGRGLNLHLGLSHGVVTDVGESQTLPFNKRFFPGGENSVRGYKRGGASPLDQDGNQLGAESVLQWNVELEQHLTRHISLVAFVDGVGTAVDVESWPMDEALWSAGGGIRWNTLIGPVRLEYGHNLNPRALDPEGTLHFSIGFPF